MAFQTLQAQIEADSSGFTSGVEDASDSADSFSGRAAGLKDSLVDINPAGLAAGAGLAGLGTGIQGLLDDTQGLRESLGRTATTMGMSTEGTRNLAQEMQNATFPMSDVVGTMDELSKHGIDSEETMREVANAADLVADATGESAQSIAEDAVPALKAMGADAEDLGEHMDTLTFMARNTSMSVGDFSNMVTKVGPELQELGMSVDETATIMAALEEKGMDSRTAMREFRQAANSADGDQQDFIKTLGLSEDQIRAQEEALQAAEGSTREHADAANESLTTMDHLRAKFDEAKLALSGYLGPMSAAAPALQALGAASMTYSTINTSMVIPSVAGLTAVSLPLLAALGGIGAVVAGLGYAWKKGWINPVETATWAAGRLMDGLTWLKDTIMEYHPLINGFQHLWESNFLGIQDTVSAVTDMIGNTIDWLVEKINKIPGVDIGGEDVDELENQATSSAGGGTDATRGLTSGGMAAPGAGGVSEGANVEPSSGTAAPSAPTRPTSPASSGGGGSNRDLAAEIANAIDEFDVVVEVEGDEAGIVEVVDARLSRVNDRARYRGGLTQ